MSQSTPSKQAKYSDSDNEFLPGDFDNKRTPSSGLKLTQHGDEYQLLLLCLCLWRVLKNKISDFLLATELPEAEKFDDVVVKYKHENRLVLRFLQAKHKEAPRPTDSIHKITLTDLLTPDEGKEFSLLKYFRSFVKILEKRSQNPVPAFLVGGDIQDFILSTNVDLTEEVEEYFEVDDEDSLEKDKVFGVPTEQPKKLKIKESDNELTRQLGVLLYTSSDFDELVEKLADCLLLQQRFDGTSWIFKEYYYPLVKHVLEIEKGRNKGSSKVRLSDNFKGANSQRTDEVEDFREALIKEIAFRRSDYKILVNISTSTGSSSSPQSNTNRKRKTSTDDSQLTKELKEFVDQLKAAMYPATSNPPNGIGLTPALFKDMILFKEVVDDKKGKFCDDFVNNPKKLKEKSRLLRKVLIDEVVNKSMAEIEFDKVSGVTFPTTEGYATRFQPKINPKIKDVEVFAKEIEDLIDNCKDHTVEITDVVGTEHFRKNIIELAGHAIVKVSSWFEFSGSFIRGYSITEDLIKLRDALRKRLGGGKFDFIDEYNLNIQLKGFTSCEEATLHRTLPRPVTKESIEGFYKNFRLIVDYPNRYVLRELLETEVKAKYQNLNSKAFVDSFVQKVYQWMTQRLGTFYTPKKVAKLLAGLDRNLSCYELDGINQSFYLALPTRYEFESEDLITLIKDFLQQTQSGVLLLRSENMTLHRVRFMQAFWSLQEANQDANDELRFYLRRFGYLFMTIEHFLDESFCQKLIKRNQDKNQWNLRLVECWAENLPETEKFGSMLDILFESSISSSVKRKVIFIVNEDISGKLESSLGSYFTSEINANFKPFKYKLKTTFSQLQASSQDELLKNGQVRLHGDNCKLGDLVNQDTGDLIDETALAKLIADRDDDTGLVCVGCITQHFEGAYDPNNYIVRHIKPVVIDIESYKMPADTEGDSYYLSKKEEGRTDFIIVADSRSKFDEMRARLMDNPKYSNSDSIHWVQQVCEPRSEKNVVWRDSIGSISNLNKYRKERQSTSSLIEEKFLESVKERKIVILHGVPGMGKSMLLRNFYIQMTDSSQPLWKIHINLNLYTDFFNKRQAEAGGRVDRIMSSSECSEFLLELLQSNEDSKLDTQFEINLLRSAFQSDNTGKIRLVLFLDGFDEISPNYKDIVLGFLLSSKTYSGTLQMFITTRPNFLKYLEENLQTFGCDIRGLTEDEQDRLLISTNRKLNKQIKKKEAQSSVQYFCCTSTAMTVFDHRNRDEGGFGAIPLHVVLFAEVYANSDREQIRRIRKNHDLSPLYQTYFKTKYRLYREEKMRLSSTNVPGKEDSQYAYDDYLKKHMNLALWMIFSREELMQIVSSFEEHEEAVLSLLDDIRAGKFKYGIIFGVSGKVPQFTHRTFAEYLVACFFVGRIRSIRKLKPAFLEFFVGQVAREAVSPFRSFCDGMMSEVDWSHCHFGDMEPSSIINWLLDSYDREEWGFFSFFAEIFKSSCHDVLPKSPHRDPPSRLLPSISQSFRKLMKDDVSTETDPWEAAFEALLEKCIGCNEYLILLTFFLKWRPKRVHKNKNASAVLERIRRPYDDDFRVNPPLYPDPDPDIGICVRVGLNPTISKFLPHWLVKNEDFDINILYKEAALYNPYYGYGKPSAWE
ncbi:unnamed protein product [Hermetia illucens]|uniref:NACHT domain-containing protein n=1 Tax=Hermetia illucens TaxID=343691 RepID=A0A7R8YVT1_HERIL|nr:unnamed protein product [Hermetia illucens]